jgi:hypothetical protein
MIVDYSTGSAADYDALVDAMELAASNFGWATTIADFGAGDNEGREATFDWAQDFIVTVRSVKDLLGIGGPSIISGPAVLVRGIYDTGSEQSEAPQYGFGDFANQNFIGPAAFKSVNTGQGETLPEGWVDTVFPANYHIFLYDEPNAMMLVVQTGPVRYQWMYFGRVVKFGNWLGGGFYGASGVAGVTSGGGQQSMPAYSLDGESENRSHAPFHRVRTSFNRDEQGWEVTNTRIHCDTGTSEVEIDDFPWTHNADRNPGTLGGGDTDIREGVANVHWSPLPARTPNQFNEISVMTPYWVQTQREADVCLIARAPHIRHIAFDNFNPGDTFENGTEQWMVFPYFEREGVTGLWGMAVRRSAGS